MRNAKHRFSDEVNNTEETVEYEETLALLNQEIARLPDTTRTIFKLSRFERYTNEEIARQMQVSAKAVEYHITVALKKLRLRFDRLIYILIMIWFSLTQLPRQNVGICHRTDHSHPVILIYTKSITRS